MKRINAMMIYGILILLLVMDVTYEFSQLYREITRAHSLQIPAQPAGSANYVPTASQFKKITHDFAIIDEITYLANLNHLELTTLKSQPHANSKDKNFFTFKLIATGDFSAFARFIEMMGEKDFIFQVNHFSIFMLPQHNISMAIEISVLKFYFSHHQSHSGAVVHQAWQDPFSMALSGADIRRATIACAATVQQIQFVGYLQKAGRTMGIVRLPDEESFSVSVGDRLGIENAEVVNITQQGMSVRVNHQNQWIEYKF